MKNIYMTVNNKVSAPLNWTTQNTVLGSSIGTGSSNGTYTITNTSGFQVSPSVVISNDPSSLEVKGKIIHNGRDLEERLSTIEKVLMIPERDVEMEKKYPKLKKLYNEYIKELSKYKMWDKLKDDEYVR